MKIRQGGCCFTFGCDGKPEIGEHFTPVALGNDQKPDCLLCKPCADAKTKKDMGRIAKVKRLQKKAAGETKKKRPIQSRGFQKDVRKKMDGTVVSRERK